MIVSAEKTTFTHRDAPLRVYGVPEFARTGELRRLPDAVIQAATNISEKLGMLFGEENVEVSRSSVRASGTTVL